MGDLCCAGSSVGEGFTDKFRLPPPANIGISDVAPPSGQHCCPAPSPSPRKAIITNPRDMAGRAHYNYERQCVVYLGKSVRIARAGLAKYQALNIVGDEARCSNAQILTMFVSTPIASDITHGFVAPTQINPDMHLDLDARSIGARIADALGKVASGLPCSSKPQGDPLVSTWHVCQCLDNALTSSMRLGLLQFQPTLEQVTLLEAGQRGLYSRSFDGRWTLTVDTEDGPVRRWLPQVPIRKKTPHIVLWLTAVFDKAHSNARWSSSRCRPQSDIMG